MRDPCPLARARVFFPRCALWRGASRLLHEQFFGPSLGHCARTGQVKVEVQIKAPLDTSNGTRKACLKPARNSLGKLPDTPAGTSPGGGRRPPPGEVLDSASWILPERVSSRFETRFSGPGACIERCFYPHLYFRMRSSEPQRAASAAT